MYGGIRQARRALLRVFILTSIILGFLVAYHLNYRADRSESRVEALILFTHGTCYHIHHWMWIAGAIGCILMGRFVRNGLLIYSLIGFMIGLALEDLLFKDWYKVRNNC